MRDLVWLAVTAIALFTGWTHTAAFMAGVYAAGFWQGFWIEFHRNE